MLSTVAFAWLVSGLGLAVLFWAFTVLRYESLRRELKRAGSLFSLSKYSDSVFKATHSQDVLQTTIEIIKTRLAPVGLRIAELSINKRSFWVRAAFGTETGIKIPLLESKNYEESVPKLGQGKDLTLWIEGRERPYGFIQIELHPNQSLEHEMLEELQLISRILALAVRALHETEIKDELLDGISREMRPLEMAIEMNTELIEQNLPEGTESDQLGLVKRTAARMKRLSSELVTFATLDSTSVQLEQESHSSTELLSELIEQVRPLSTQKTISLLSLALIEDDAQVLGDRERILHSLFSLVDYLIHAVRPETVIQFESNLIETALIRYRISARLRTEIDDNVLRIFRPTSQKTLARRQGVGRSLALSKKIIETYGGDISLETKQDLNIEFSVTLPSIRSLPRALPTVDKLKSIREQMKKSAG